MLVLAFAAVYLIWGSTYLAIRAGIETLPAWLLVFFRFSLAGSIALGLGHFRREPELTPRARLLALGSGALMILSNGLVAISEASLASGIVAVVVGATPIWMMLLGWLCFGRGRPGVGKLAGALFGLGGIGLIAGGHFQGAGGIGLVALGAANLLWAFGTLMQSGQPRPGGVFRFAGLQMLTGAALAGPIALIWERPWDLDFTGISLTSWGP